MTRAVIPHCWARAAQEYVPGALGAQEVILLDPGSWWGEGSMPGGQASGWRALMEGIVSLRPLNRPQGPLVGWCLQPPWGVPGASSISLKLCAESLRGPQTINDNPSRLCGPSWGKSRRLTAD